MAIVHQTGKAEENRLTLKDIFSMPDDLGLLNIKAISSSSPKDLNTARFEEINQFIDQNGRQPLDDAKHLNEKQLARRLKSILTNPQNMTELRSLDRHKLFDAPLLQPSPKQQEPEPVEVSVAAENVTSLDDIFNSDALGLLNIEASDIFDIKHVPAIEREMPDEIAQRTHCADFYEFTSIFKRYHANIESKSAEIVPFKSGSQIDEGDVFILRGMLCLVDKIELSNETGERYNPRLRVIFENGTESNLLLRSLAAALYKDENGRRILKSASDIEKSFQGITHKDNRSGVVYIVTTLSNNPKLRAIPNLFKIGYTESTVEERTKNAERDVAFLESPIQIIASIECFNLNPHRFESLIHGFLSAQRLTIELTGKNGQIYRPKEWFSVPLETAREVVKRIIDGTIIQYRINNTTGQLIQKKLLQ
jgi:hypothetical protein